MSKKLLTAFLNACLGSTERAAWRGVGRKGWQRVGERLRRVDEGLAQGWRRVGGFLASSSLQFPKRPFRRAGL